MARLWPISLGRRTVPPSTRGTPQRRQYTPSTAPAAATRRSHHSASSSPPATACPSMAAITGLLSTSRVGPIGPSPSGVSRLPRPSTRAWRSAPEQNDPAAPVSMATLSASSASKRRNAAASASAWSRSMALRRSGRSMVTTTMGPSGP